ncbi:hypothetical protein A5885_000390, partial [Enterococcus sp. 8E11_MSG4843]
KKKESCYFDNKQIKGGNKT